MDTIQKRESFRSLSVAALIFGALGGAFYWWVPLGMVLGLTGLVFGFVDCTVARRRSLDFRLSLIAMLLSIAVLILDTVIAVLGMQTITFGSPLR